MFDSFDAVAPYLNSRGVNARVNLPDVLQTKNTHNNLYPADRVASVQSHRDSSPITYVMAGMYRSDFFCLTAMVCDDHCVMRHDTSVPAARSA
jgi:hypothetical protein